jgi:dihydroorotase
VRVTAEASPHHLTLTDEAVASLDTSLKMNPPLRTEDDRRSLVDGLRDGTIDCIATDHAPHARDEKDVPFEQAPMGTTGLETAFAAVHTDLVVPGVLPLALVVERLSAGAALLGLPVPRIAVGAPADLTLVDLDGTWEVGPTATSRARRTAASPAGACARVVCDGRRRLRRYRRSVFALPARSPA